MPIGIRVGSSDTICPVGVWTAQGSSTRTMIPSVHRFWVRPLILPFSVRLINITMA